jgi:glycerophosphoryl diester phosphodiesterase
MRLSHLLCLALLAISACKKDDFDIHNLNGGKIIAQGHGGMGIFSTYPLDSPSSILACLYSGADGSEMDVQMTSDSVLVAYHPGDLSDATDMDGPVISHTWEEVQQARFLGVPYTEHHIARLDELFASISDPRQYICTFDIKIHPNGIADEIFMDRMADAVIRLLDRYDLADRVHLESQQPYMLAALQVRRAGLKLFYYPPTFEEGLATAQQMGLYGLTIDLNKITTEQIAEAHAHNLWVAVWNVQSKAENRDAIGMNPEIIQSDRVDHLVGLLD